MKKQRLLIINIPDKYRKIYSKSLHLKADLIEAKVLDMTYDEYITPSLLYFTQDLQEIAKLLGVRKVIPKGQYIMGLLGGETGRGEPYAGLVLEEHKYDNNEFEFRLYGITTKLRVPIDWLRKYGVHIYELIYVGMINPFSLNRSLPILLSNRGARYLCEFFKVSLEANAMKIPSDDARKISILMNELKQPESLKTLNEDSYYVVYRCDRAFTACFIKPSPLAILDSHVSAIECDDENKAHYYVAILNYLAYKVIMEGRTFIHHQFARPTLAVIIAGLSWKDIDEKIRNRVAELGKQLSQKIPIRKFSNQKVALKYIANYTEFKDLVKLLDETVDRERLKEALNLVSGKRR